LRRTADKLTQSAQAWLLFRGDFGPGTVLPGRDRERLRPRDPADFAAVVPSTSSQRVAAARSSGGR
jgi:hypothetical protein